MSRTSLLFGLSKHASEQIRAWQRDLWRTSEDIRPLSLPPLIPLMWHQTRHIEIPRMPRPISFDTPKIVEGHLYLCSTDERWTALLDRIGIRCVPDDGKRAFPCHPGIYLGLAMGQDVPTATIMNNDWRLLGIRCTWHTDGSRIVHLRHYIEEDRHLIS